MEFRAYTEKVVYSSWIRKKVTISTFGGTLTVTNRESKKVKLRFNAFELTDIDDIIDMQTLNEDLRNLIIKSERLLHMQADSYLLYLSTLQTQNQFTVVRVGKQQPILIVKVKPANSDVCLWEFWQMDKKSPNELQLCLVLSKEEFYKLSDYATAYCRGHI